MELQELIEQYRSITAQIAVLKKDLATAEKAIIDSVGAKKEGAQSSQYGDFKVTTTGKMTRTISADGAMNLRSTIPESFLNRLITWKPSLSVKEVRYLQNNEPELYAELCKEMVTKPAKTSLKVEAL